MPGLQNLRICAFKSRILLFYGQILEKTRSTSTRQCFSDTYASAEVLNVGAKDGRDAAMTEAAYETNLAQPWTLDYAIRTFLDQ